MIYFYGNTELFEDESIKIIDADTAVKFIESIDSYIALDLETTGLDFTRDEIVLVAISTGKDSLVIDYRLKNTQIFNALKTLIESQKCLGANIKFDYKFLRKQGIKINEVYDVILAERVLLNGLNSKKKSLDAIIQRRLKYQLDKSITKSFINIQEHQIRYSHIKYAAEDVQFLHHVRELQLREAHFKGLTNVVKLENDVTLAFADIEFNGLKIDKEKWLVLYEKNKKQAAELWNKLDQMVIEDESLQDFIPKYVQGDFFNPPRAIHINWDSPKQVLEVFKRFVPNLDSVEATVIQKFKSKFELIKVYLEYKEFKKLETTYGKEFLVNVKEDGCIHTDFNQIVSTGRVSSKEPNLQQIPASNDYRNCFIPQHKDWVFVSADYSSQELALIAYASKDPVWLNALEHGYDLHSVCAELVFGKEWEEAAEETCVYYAPDEDSNSDLQEVKILKHKCECKKHKQLRNAVKSINFGLAYGMSPFALSERLNISVDEAKDLINKYFTVFPKIKKYLESSAKYGLLNGNIKTLAPWKRIRYFEGWHSGITYDREKVELKGQIERQSKNTPIQGSGSDMTKFALANLNNYLHKHDVPVLVVNTVHDQIDTVCPKEFSEEWAKILVEIMEKSAQIIIPTGLLKADYTISEFWKK
jgi:DNA polymerase-1